MIKIVFGIMILFLSSFDSSTLKNDSFILCEYEIESQDYTRVWVYLNNEPNYATNRPSKNNTPVYFDMVIEKHEYDPNGTGKHVLVTKKDKITKKFKSKDYQTLDIYAGFPGDNGVKVHLNFYHVVKKGSNTIKRKVGSFFCNNNVGAKIGPGNQQVHRKSIHFKID